jgi:formate-dependent phosphoribosylglycinamide formyltransferase (GAR transformylase)
VTTHVALLGPDLFAAFNDYPRALQELGVRVTGIGATPKARLRAGLSRHLDHWEEVANPFDGDEVALAVGRLPKRVAPDRLETLDERLIEPAAAARERVRLPGLSLAAARLCRDKPAMKDALRAAKLPCADSTAASTRRELAEFAERVGFPLIVKPRAGLGAQKTYRIDGLRDIEAAAATLGLDRGGEVAVEEFVEGHEGFFDTLSIDGEPQLEFISHYYPSVLEALSDRKVAPQIAATNRVELASYSELRQIGRRVIRALGIATGATHMEWFFGPKGLKVSEIGARPPGERIWDLYCVGNDLDLYREWASAIAFGRVEGRPSRRYATGSVQVRPDREGRVVAYSGLDRVLARVGSAIWQSEVPAVGRKTVPIEKGYLANAWFRLKHEDYDELLELMGYIGRTLRVRAVP